MISSIPHIDFKVNRRFRRLALNTVITLYCLILAGGVVRSTGAGMGCPDWPKCFGTWVPPTKLSQLPSNYKTLYGAKLKGEVIFNPVKTWIEYANRMLGAFTGLMIFFTLLASIPFIGSGQQRIFYFSLAAFFLVGFQGWLGSKVVSSELLPAMITLHMLLAIVIVFILLYLYTWASFSGDGLDKKYDWKALRKVGWVALILSFLQIILGTQVRENMDVVIRSLGYDERWEWIDQLGVKFYVHRSFSLLVLAVNGFWLYSINQKAIGEAVLNRLTLVCATVLFMELITGVVMAYLGVPPFAQPLHLTLAVLFIGLQFVIWLVISGQRYLWRVV